MEQLFLSTTIMNTPPDKGTRVPKDDTTAGSPGDTDDRSVLSNEDFLAIWRPLVEGEAAQTAAFDRVIIALASGALAVSITFIHDIAPNPTEEHWLAIGWLGFGSSLAVNVVSYLVGQFAYRRQVEILQDVADGKPNAEEQPNVFRTAAMWMNAYAAFAFVVGVVGIGLFAWTNLKR
ncbi:MAG: hypothetical protein M3441_20425 [Chloroflexota bacterium]|nr:hypothetical protein [Chloroflexota bacterium]